MKNSTRTYWSAVLDDFRRSGLGVRDFCARRGVAVQTFYLRRRQLTFSAPAFIEARIVPDVPAPDIVIELPSRERILVPQQTSRDSIATVLGAIAQAGAHARVGGAA